MDLESTAKRLIGGKYCWLLPINLEKKEAINGPQLLRLGDQMGASMGPTAFYQTYKYRSQLPEEWQKYCLIFPKTIDFFGGARILYNHQGLWFYRGLWLATEYWSCSLYKLIKIEGIGKED